MNLLIIGIVIFVISILYIFKFKEYFTSQQCGNLNVSSIDPNHPNCISSCIHDYTWTDNNKTNFTKIIGNLKEDTNPEKLKASNCFKCVRNFYHGIKLINDNRCA